MPVVTGVIPIKCDSEQTHATCTGIAVARTPMSVSPFVYANKSGSVFVWVWTPVLPTWEIKWGEVIAKRFHAVLGIRFKRISMGITSSALRAHQFISSDGISMENTFDDRNDMAPSLTTTSDRHPSKTPLIFINTFLVMRQVGFSHFNCRYFVVEPKHDAEKCVPTSHRNFPPVRLWSICFCCCARVELHNPRPNVRWHASERRHVVIFILKMMVSLLEIVGIWIRKKKKLESIRARVFIFSPNDRVADGHMLNLFWASRSRKKMSLTLSSQYYLFVWSSFRVLYYFFQLRAVLICSNWWNNIDTGIANGLLRRECVREWMPRIFKVIRTLFGLAKAQQNAACAVCTFA